jgi:hypothetical protein
MYPKSLQQLEPFLLKRKQRFVDILLWQLYQNGKINNENSLGFHEDVLNCINSLKSLSKLNEFSNDEQLLTTYLKQSELSLVPDDYLSWIDSKDNRQCHFIWLSLKQLKAFNDVSMSSIGNANKYYIAIKGLDRLPNNEQKRQLLISIRQAWEQAKSYSGWRYDWLDINSDSQCEKALKFLTKNISEKAKGYDKPALVNDDNELTDYYKFLASVDCWVAPSKTKLVFYNKITDAARKWKTPQQKKAQNKLKIKAKENNHVLLKDKKSLEMLQSIQIKLDHKNINDTLKYILNKEYNDVCTKQVLLTETTKEIELKQLSRSLNPFDLLKERARRQLKTLCDYSVKLQKAGIFDNKMNIASKHKSDELFKDKEKELFEGIIK